MTDSTPNTLGTWAAVIMSIAALASSWAGYQASLWNGEQAIHGGRATALRTYSTRAYTRAGQWRLLDVGLFSNWAEAYAREDTLLARFYERRFRPEFTPAFRAWVASHPLESPNAAPSPFGLPEYQLADEDSAARLADSADVEAKASVDANRTSDGYVLHAVILAMAMFFGGAAQQAGSKRLRLPMVVIAALVCSVGLIRLLATPRA